MGKHLLDTKKLPCEDTYQKFHSKIHDLGILLFPSTHHLVPKFQPKYILFIRDMCKS